MGGSQRLKSRPISDGVRWAVTATSSRPGWLYPRGPHHSTLGGGLTKAHSQENEPSGSPGWRAKPPSLRTPWPVSLRVSSQGGKSGAGSHPTSHVFLSWFWPWLFNDKVAVTFQQRGGAGVGSGACGEAVINTKRHQRCDAATMGARGGTQQKGPTQYFWRRAWTLPRGATRYQMTLGIRGVEEETLCAKGTGKVHCRARNGWMRPAILPPIQVPTSTVQG